MAKKRKTRRVKQEDDEVAEEDTTTTTTTAAAKKSRKTKTKAKTKTKRVKQENEVAEEDTTTTTTGKEEEVAEEEPPTDKVLRAHIRRLIPLVNLQNTGVKAFTKLLSKECGGADLKARSKFIKIALSEAINEMDDDDSSEEADESDDDEPKKKAPRKTGLSVKKEISPELATFLGKDKDEMMARTDIVKDMWVYIKAHELQNPENKREIFLDKKMKKVFGCDSFTMFTMNKYLGAHIHPFKPVDLTTNTAKKKKATTAGKKRKKKGDGGDDDDDKKKKRKAKKPGLQPRKLLFLESYINLFCLLACIIIIVLMLHRLLFVWLT